MSLDVTLYHTRHISYDGGKTFFEEEDREEFYSANITHNLNTMAEQAGIYEALWRPHRLREDCPKHFKNHQEEYAFEESVTCYAKDIIPVLEEGLQKLKSDPAHYRKFDSPNGWGLYQNFVPFVEKYLEACKEYPEAKISVNR